MNRNDQGNKTGIRVVLKDAFSSHENQTPSLLLETFGRGMLSMIDMSLQKQKSQNSPRVLAIPSFPLVYVIFVVKILGGNSLSC